MLECLLFSESKREEHIEDDEPEETAHTEGEAEHYGSRDEDEAVDVFSRVEVFEFQGENPEW